MRFNPTRAIAVAAVIASSGTTVRESDAFFNHIGNAWNSATSAVGNVLQPVVNVAADVVSAPVHGLRHVARGCPWPHRRPP